MYDGTGCHHCFNRLKFGEHNNYKSVGLRIKKWRQRIHLNSFDESKKYLNLAHSVIFQTIHHEEKEVEKS